MDSVEARSFADGKEWIKNYFKKKSKDIEDTTFPPMLKNEFVCKSCYQLESCALYHATVEKGTLESSGMDEKTWNSTVGHLTDQDKSYVVF